MRVLIQFLRATSAHSPNAMSPKFCYEARAFVWCFKTNTYSKSERVFVHCSSLPSAVLEALKGQGAKSGNVFCLEAHAGAEPVLIEAHVARAHLAKRPYILKRALEAKTA